MTRVDATQGSAPVCDRVLSKLEPRFQTAAGRDDEARLQPLAAIVHDAKEGKRVLFAALLLLDELRKQSIADEELRYLVDALLTPEETYSRYAHLPGYAGYANPVKTLT